MKRHKDQAETYRSLLHYMTSLPDLFRVRRPRNNLGFVLNKSISLYLIMFCIVQKVYLKLISPWTSWLPFYTFLFLKLDE